jgi:hypothetical protein
MIASDRAGAVGEVKKITQWLSCSLKNVIQQFSFLKEIHILLGIYRILLATSGDNQHGYIRQPFERMEFFPNKFPFSE